MTNYRVAVLPGDGIGQEIVPPAVNILKKIGSKYGIRFDFCEALVGGAAVDAVGVPLPEDTLKLCRESDAMCC
jgi:3-isopropylmalate dehydrogenase